MTEKRKEELTINNAIKTLTKRVHSNRSNHAIRIKLELSNLNPTQYGVLTPLEHEMAWLWTVLSAIFLLTRSFALSNAAPLLSAPRNNYTEK